MYTVLFGFQLVCDDNLLIRNINTGWPGSVHDARVFRTSSLGMDLRRDNSVLITDDNFIIG